MRTLVIPDIHETPLKVRVILEMNKYDQVIYLGDWFDSFTSTPEGVKATKDLLNQELAKENRFFCWGNHDIHYGDRGCRCSGFEQSTYWQVADINFSKFQVAHEIDGWLLSHAGFRPETKNLIDKALNGESDDHVYSMVGRARGGYDKFGGPLWLDWNHEFKPIPGIKQIVGHTPANEVRCLDGNYCLDTGLRHYGIIDNGSLLVIQT